MAETDPQSDPIADEEAEAAAAEAARIGGPTPDGAIVDPAQRPLVEGGEGEAEGFELAEEELVENAEGVGEGDPLADRFTPEEGDAEDGPAYGEPDEIDSTELDDDDGD